jgi:glycosyltransferase involved in cell wall biosynthesis
MEEDYLICIPVYKVGDRVRKCINSIDDYEHVLLIDNTGTQECKEFEYLGLEVSYQDENIGVPRAWNIGLRRNHEWTFVVSSSMFFPNGFKKIGEMLKGYEGLMFRSSHVWHCNAVNKKLVEKIGYFDENFYPGYFEDCDWDHRCGLERINEYGNIQIDAECQVDGGATKDGCDVRINAVHDYFKDKWGGKRTRGGWGEYLYPFNNPSLALSYWEENSIDFLKNKYGLS